jgi:hypothetical protein
MKPNPIHPFIVAAALPILAVTSLAAQHTATVALRADAPGPVVNPNIYHSRSQTYY